MHNPFQKRASEHLVSSEAFLPLVSPVPLDLILNNSNISSLLDKLVFVLGTPGSGKTTFGRMFEFDTLMTLHERKLSPALKPMVKVLTDHEVLSDSGPAILAARLAMDNEYREIWELPYDDRVKKELLLKLIQSRSVLLWCNALASHGIKEDEIEVVTTQYSPGAIEAIGASDIVTLRTVAARVETEVYKVIHSLVPKKLEEIDSALVPYDPLSHLKEFIIKTADAQWPLSLKPMLIVDDAHELHTGQFTELSDYLINRDLSAARWIMTRYDIAITANEWILQHSGGDKPGRQLGRDFQVLLTSHQADPTQKRTFRAAAQDIANRYLKEMDVFNRAQQTRLDVMLLETCKGISNSNLELLNSKIQSDVATLRISAERVAKLNEIVREYSSTKNESPDVSLAMLRILLHRYSKRTPQQQLFSEAIDVEPSRELKADAGIMAGAKLHLMEMFDRPYYYGVDAVADSGNGNIEQFLRTADELVRELEAKLIRKKQKIHLTAEEQHRIIRETAIYTMEHWDFPLHRQVIQLVDFIGNKAKEASLLPNAYLDQGANAYGVLRDDFDSIMTQNRQLAIAIHYGIAYNAISINPGYHCKNQVWTLIQLGGYPIIKYGLPFNRGGFVEGTMKSIYNSVKWDQ